MCEEMKNNAVELTDEEASAVSGGMWWSKDYIQCEVVDQDRGGIFCRTMCTYHGTFLCWECHHKPSLSQDIQAQYKYFLVINPK